MKRIQIVAVIEVSDEQAERIIKDVEENYPTDVVVNGDTYYAPEFQAEIIN